MRASTRCAVIVGSSLLLLVGAGSAWARQDAPGAAAKPGLIGRTFQKVMPVTATVRELKRASPELKAASKAAYRQSLKGEATFLTMVGLSSGLTAHNMTGPAMQQTLGPTTATVVGGAALLGAVASVGITLKEASRASKLAVLGKAIEASGSNAELRAILERSPKAVQFYQKHITAQNASATKAVASGEAKLEQSRANAQQTALRLEQTNALLK
jgi:hypothetical protein